MARARPRKTSPTVVAPHPGERLSHVTENYLLSLYVLKEEGIRTTLSHLADYLRQLPAGEGLGTSLPSVAGMVRRMQREELIVVGTNKEISLTERGLVHAEDMVRRHRLAERLAVDLLGVELHRAHEEAHRLEHAISPELQTKIAQRLGQPMTCPFGHPIPGSGRSPHPNVIPLTKARAGVPYLVDRVPEENEELLKFLVENIIIPEHSVTVKEAAPYRGVISMTTEAREVSLGYEAAARIWVRPMAP